MALLNPKPIGAFIEYTLKPLLDEARDLIEIMDEHGFKRSDLKYAVLLFVLQMLFDFAKGILITGMICLTLRYILTNSPHSLVS